MSAVSPFSRCILLASCFVFDRDLLKLLHNHAEWAGTFGSITAGWLLRVGSNAATSLIDSLGLVIDNAVGRLGTRHLGLDTTGSVCESLKL